VWYLTVPHDDFDEESKELNNEDGNDLPAAGVRDGFGAHGARPVRTAAAQDHRRADDPYTKTGGYCRAGHEIRATVPLYLDGKIQQWFTRGDGRGVIFILNCKDVAEARALIESLPLSKENLMDEQFIPVGPLLPLGILLRDSPTNK
jgi:hypothetical protein